MRIAVLIRNFRRNSGGAERYCVELTERLSQYHDVHVFCQTFDKSSFPIEFHKISKFFDKPRFLNQILFSYLTKKETNRNFDIVHSHELVSTADIYTIHVPCFKTIVNNNKGLKKFLKNLNILLSPRKISYLLLERQQMKNINKRHFISVSEYLLRNIVDCYPFLKNISIAYPGTNTKLVNHSNNIEKSLISELSIPNNAFKILLVANNFQKKGLPTIIKSLELLKNKNLYLLVAGNDKQKTNVKSEHIHFLGLVQDMDHLFNQVDLLIHPTLTDTYGMAPLEAMSAKLPVIISSMEYCGFSEHLSQNDALILDNPLDEIELANKIDFLYRNIDERNKIAQNGFRLSKTISWEATLNKTLSTYNSFLK
jgi:glycosyltransferase involved in cell wall biosynthesis